MTQWTMKIVVPWIKVAPMSWMSWPLEWIISMQSISRNPFPLKIEMPNRPSKPPPWKINISNFFFDLSTFSEIVLGFRFQWFNGYRSKHYQGPLQLSFSESLVTQSNKNQLFSNFAFKLKNVVSWSLFWFLTHNCRQKLCCKYSTE
jgi:hypothetical protein